MSKKFVPMPPIRNLPLVVKIDLDNDFDKCKADFESRITALIDNLFTIDFNTNEVWAYSAPSSAGASNIFNGYVEGFIKALTSYLDEYRDMGKAHFNRAVSASKLVLAVNELGENAKDIDADAVEGAPHDGYYLVAEVSIEHHYESCIEKLREEIAKSWGMNDIVLDPNFKEIFKIIDERKEDNKWQCNFGEVAYSYFEDGLRQDIEKYKGNVIFKEGFAKVVTSKTIRLRIVKRTKSGKVNEPVLEDGVQTTVEGWGTWASSIAEDMIYLF